MRRESGGDPQAEPGAVAASAMALLLGEQGESVCAITAAAARFEGVSLAELGGAALMDRIDTKFLVPTRIVAGLVEPLSRHYRVLEVDGRRLFRYSTEYFDGSDLELYHAHHAGRAPRIKVRVRTYVDTGDRYLEVKQKTNKGRTRKVRVALGHPGADPLHRLAQEGYFGLADALSKMVLRPAAVVDYTRMTLVAKDAPERLTLDLVLTFSRGDRVRSFPGVVVAEVKQERRAPSAFHESMRHLGMRAGALSKYCLGIACLEAGAKQNQFKSILRRLEKLGEVSPAGHPQPVLTDGHRA